MVQWPICIIIRPDPTIRMQMVFWYHIVYHIVEERNSRHGSGGFSPERGGGSRQCDLDPSPVCLVRPQRNIRNSNPNHFATYIFRPLIFLAEIWLCPVQSSAPCPLGCVLMSWNPTIWDLHSSQVSNSKYLNLWCWCSIFPLHKILFCLISVQCPSPFFPTDFSWP